MKARLVTSGEVEINSQRYTYDVVIAGGTIRRRDKTPSKPLKSEYGHTPLSAQEDIPWDCERLIIGTGLHGALPVLDAVRLAAEDHYVELVIVPTAEACQLLEDADLSRTHAILHVKD